MFSLTQRFQVVSNQAITFSLVIIAFVVASSWIQLLYPSNVFQNTTSAIANVTPSMTLRTSRYYGSQNGKPKENVRVSFDLESDFSPLFNWNTKQIFVYLTANYNSSGSINEVTFWDDIITSKDKALVQLKNAKSKYTVWDLESGLSGKELDFKLHWNIQPWVGPLVYGETDISGDHKLTVEARKKNTESGDAEKVSKRKKKRTKKQKVN
ncbi:hypothetical protein NCAS_0E01540 [Naumovozyma castellii]|uniref:Signal peptidase subunit 3 n=1 Tax=Naumovozyma castellii TaxID=27288 RepID=G0VFF8_NAUCA|nr:hypothetical protein NCAS_0E01540 [Naumovozyma castellii CBS 4309]CCC70224.1 hypothetical protein NCAS_0E01540 [Naumovozyma castellii CBS 4309]